MSIIFRLTAFSAFVCLSAQLLTAQTISLPKTMPPDVQQRIERVTTCLHPEVQVKDDPHPCTTLSARMAQLHIPGVSIAVVHNGVIEWAAGFGGKQLGAAPGSVDSLFQAGSISEPVAGAVTLQQGSKKKLSLAPCVNKDLVCSKSPSNPAA